VQAAQGGAADVIMPLYRTARKNTPSLAPIGPPFEVPLGPRTEYARVFGTSLGGRGARAFFIEHDDYFDRAGVYGEGGADYPDNALRFAFFCRAALAALPYLAPDCRVVHAHDWHAALALIYLRTHLAQDPRFAHLASVLSVHNAAFQGHFAPETLAAIGLPSQLFDWRALEWYGRVNLLKGAAAVGDAIVTVSPTHREELRTPEGGFGLHDTFNAVRDRLTGIRNGIDLDVWNPATDKQIAANYSAADVSGKRYCKAALQRAFGLSVSPELPLVAMCARLTEQKGIDLVLGAVPHAPNTQFIIVGEGEPRYAQALASLARQHPDRVAVDLNFRDATEHLLLAGADIVLIPSRFEPCGLTQMRAQRYGAIPVARRVGGLADTIRDGVTGFLFDEYGVEALTSALARALEAREQPDLWQRYVRAAMMEDFGWDHPARRYLEVYRQAAARRASFVAPTE
jgi:starch synthase